VLWGGFQEPVAAWARPRIRRAEVSLRETMNDSHSGSSKSLEESLLESVLTHTQIDVLFDEMDAADEARRDAAAQQAELRRREREAAEMRRREEAEARQHERERQARLSEEARRAESAARQRQQDESDERQRAIATLQHAMSEAGMSEARSAARSAARRQTDAADAEHPGISNFFRRMVATSDDDGRSSNNTAPVQRHTAAPMMRESEVRGRLVRFLSGMRAYERQQMETRGSGQQLPLVLSDFIAWSGNFVTNFSAEGTASRRERDEEAQTKAAVRRYMGHDDDRTGIATVSEEGFEHVCTICLENLGDASLFDALGEPVQTACGHIFHAVCFARHMESSQQDPWCPVCRGTDLAVRFVTVSSI